METYFVCFCTGGLDVGNVLSIGSKAFQVQGGAISFNSCYFGIKVFLGSDIEQLLGQSICESRNRRVRNWLACFNVWNVTCISKDLHDH